MYIVVDFDGTCVSHEFPKVGNEIGAVPVLRRLVKSGHQLILFTMRCNHVVPPISSDKDIHSAGGNYLTEAVNWFEKNGIPLYGVQTNPTQHEWTSSPKAYGNIIIDDTALGCPLIHDISVSSRPFVDWKQVEYILEKEGVLPNREATII